MSYPAAPHTNGKATASLVTGIITLVLSPCCVIGLLGLVAVVLGAQARNEIRASQGSQSGQGLALAGTITGAVATFIGASAIVVLVLLYVHGQAHTSIDFRGR